MENTTNNVDIKDMEEKIVNWLNELEKCNFVDFYFLIKLLVENFDRIFSKYDYDEMLDALTQTTITGEVKSFRDLI